MSTGIIPIGYCHCGCGQETKIAPKTSTGQGYVKGEPYKFLKGHRLHPNLPHDMLLFRSDNERKCKVCGKWKDITTGFYRKSGYMCRACRNAQVKAQREAKGSTHREEDRARHWRRRYGLTPEDYEAMFTVQDGRCALCERQLKPNATAVDHDHETGTTRGLLCYGCNAALGMFNDDPALLRKAAGYVEGYKPPM